MDDQIVNWLITISAQLDCIIKQLEQLGEDNILSLETPVPTSTTTKEDMPPLKVLLIKKCIRQEELSRMMGVSPSAISRYISGETFPRGRNLIKMASALNINVEELAQIIYSGGEK